MPVLNVAGLIGAYVAIAVLLLSVNLYSRWSWPGKLAINVVVAWFFWVTYVSYPKILGWPTQQNLPKRFYLNAVLIDEPDWVYIWGTDLDQGLEQPPRSFRVRYTKTLHDRANKASRKLRRGLPLIGEVNPELGGVGKEESIAGENKVSDVHFLDAPQALVPGKDR